MTPSDQPSDGARPSEPAKADDGVGDPSALPDEAAGDDGTSIAAVARQASLPRPPRRTGVFLDADDLRTHVGGLLRAILGGYEVDAFGNHTFTHDDARIFVTVNPSPIGPQVGVLSVTNLDLPLTGELATMLLTTNHGLGFGAFSYDRSTSAVWLRHTLLGTTLDGPELQSAVAAVATTAAELGPRIRDQYGGRTFAEAPEDVRRGVEPPTPDPDATHNASGYL